MSPPRANDLAIAINSGDAEGFSKLREQLQGQKMRVTVRIHGVDLQEFDLSDLSLERSHINGCNLVGTKLSNADLSNVDFDGSDLREAQLDGCTLTKTNLSKAQLAGARLNKARLNETLLPVNCDKIDLSGATLHGVQLVGRTFRGAKLCHTQFGVRNSGHNMTGCDLTEADLSHAKLCSSNLSEANFAHANLTKADLSGVTINDSDLSTCTLEGAVLENTQLARTPIGAGLATIANGRGLSITGVDLSELDLSNAPLSHAKLNNVDFHSTKLISADLSHSQGMVGLNLSHALLRDADISNARWPNAQMPGVDLRHAKLHDTDLSRANLQGADLRYAQANGATNLELANVEGCRISQFVFDSMKEHGGLLVGQRALMRVENPIAELRSYFSGFLQWIHLLALVVFLAPYTWFLFHQWTRVQFTASPSDDAMPIGIALLRFIYTGGQDWQSSLSCDLNSFVPFSIALVYNATRAALLYKTKKLELHQEAYGFSEQFELQGSWRLVFKLAKYGIWVNAAGVLYHSGHFLSLPIPT